jgi:hypothetical protein
MTSHYIDLFVNRADTTRNPSTSSSKPSPPSIAGNLTASSLEAKELAGAAEDGCTFCEIVTGKQEAYKVSLPSQRFRFTVLQVLT